MLFLTEESEYTTQNTNQVLYFYRNSMPFQQLLQGMLEREQEKHRDIAFFAIDVDYFSGLCKRFSVTSIPAIILLREGKEAKRLHGLVTAASFADVFADICSPVSPKLEKIHG